MCLILLLLLLADATKEEGCNGNAATRENCLDELASVKNAKKKLGKAKRQLSIDTKRQNEAERNLEQKMLLWN